MTDAEINEAVARKLGWVQCCNPKTMEKGKIADCFGWSKGGSHFHEVYPNYSGSIAAAWEIVEKVGHCRIDKNNGGWHFNIRTGPSEGIACTATTAPMAICLAFLKLA